MILRVFTVALLLGITAAHAQDATTSDGGRYWGPIVNGRPHGWGRIEWDNGARYRGEMADGVFAGRGRFEAQNGEIYEGDFEQGAFTGQGTYSRPDGTRYRGGFRNWRFSGEGRFVQPTGDIYEGTFTDGQLNGRGKATATNGDTYEGEFRNGMFDGKGTLRYAQPRMGRTQITGVFKENRLVDDPELREAGRQVEAALMGQRKLLDDALAALAPGRKGVVDLYLLAVGGDGSQEVFRREVEFVRSQFDARFGTGSRSVALVNSRTTVATQPMATQTSIGEALKAIAGKMDRDEDILFLFLTSHGSRDHAFSLKQNWMTLRDLPAVDLGRLVRESGIRYKVVVVSACYSGGFIEPLKDDTTMVITAARADRASFGCADEADFTWFGRAYFKEALPAARSFQEAFARADALVAEWEKKEQPREERSLPQLHTTPAIDRQLHRWWAQRPSP
jgi:hypothetical protein